MGDRDKKIIMAQFSDTTNKNGLIQKFEFWARLTDGEVTGTLLKQVTDRINQGFDRIMPILLAYNDQIRWDDLNHTDAPIGRLNLVANQNDYKITEDDNSLDILNITHVRILPSATGTIYQDLQRISSDDLQITEILSPNTAVTGTPSGFVELGNRIYLDVLPSYSATNGIEIFFGREQSYFVSTDTTKEPGIPKLFHELLALYAALDYVSVNRPDEANTLTIIRNRIAEIERDLKRFINLRNPSKAKMTMKSINHF